MSRIERWVFLMILVGITLAPLPAEALLSGSRTIPGDTGWATNDLTILEPGQFQTSGPDPHLVSPEFDVPLNSLTGIIGRIQVDTPSPEIHCQLFYRTESSGFSEPRSYRFSLIPRGAEPIVFFLPTATLAESAGMRPDERLKTVRFDIDTPSPCVLTLISFQILTEDPGPYTRYIPETIVYPIRIRPAGGDISDNGPWIPNDLSLDSDGWYTVTGGDPFWTSPDLDVPLTDIQGVYFRMKLEGKMRCRMQLFWKSHGNDFQERHSFLFHAVFRDGLAEWVVPLVLLPRDDVLHTLRLDVENCTECRFQILSAKLIREEFQEMKHLVPRQIMYSFGKSVYARGVWRDIAANLWVDKPFWVVYGILIAIVVWILYYLQFGHRIKRPPGEYETRHRSTEQPDL
jgi:hypothetical protein